MKAGLGWTAGAVLLFLAVVAAEKSLRRTAPQVVVVNDSGSALANLRVVTFDSADEYTDGPTELAPGGQLIVSVRTPDLYLRAVTFTLAGRAVTYHQGAIACWGETLILTVYADGSVVESHGPFRW